ncbi:MAG: phosphatase PAP2 family protein [Pseudomonadota bacterium]
MSWLHLIEQADHRLIVSLQTVRHAPVIGAFKAVSRTGDGYLQVVCLVLALWVASDASLRFLEAAVLAFFLERSLYIVAKRRFRRRRPAAALPAFVALVKPSDEFSFPSGHTMAAFLLATLLHTALGMSAVVVYTWAMLVGCSRVVLGVHFPSDIVVGAVLGIGIAMIGVGFV